VKSQRSTDVKPCTVRKAWVSPPAPEKQTIPDFAGAREDGVAVASDGPCANHLHLAPDRQPC